MIFLNSHSCPAWILANPWKKQKNHHFINLFLSARSEIFPVFIGQGKLLWGLFWFFYNTFSINKQQTNREKKLKKFLYSHFGIITIYCSWMIFNFFIWTNKHKNMFMLYVAKKRKKKKHTVKKRTEWMKSEIPRSSCKMKFHCCPFIIGGLTVMFFCCCENKNYDFVFL